MDIARLCFDQWYVDEGRLSTNENVFSDTTQTPMISWLHAVKPNGTVSREKPRLTNYWQVVIDILVSSSTCWKRQVFPWTTHWSCHRRCYSVSQVLRRWINVFFFFLLYEASHVHDDMLYVTTCAALWCMTLKHILERLLKFTREEISK